MAIINVGAATEAELKEKKARVEVANARDEGRGGRASSRASACWIATNAGHEGSIAVQRTRETGDDEGFNAQSERYESEWGLRGRRIDGMGGGMY